MGFLGVVFTQIRDDPFFCEYDTVFTDRLHGMIFAALLNRKFEILDNSYGKPSNYKECWFDSDSMRNI